jgi:hypothetical protein
MKALQSQHILPLLLGILLGTASALENLPSAAAADLPDILQRDAGAAQPMTAPAPVDKPVGLDVAQLGRSLDQGDIDGSIEQIELG